MYVDMTFKQKDMGLITEKDHQDVSSHENSNSKMGCVKTAQNAKITFTNGLQVNIQF